MQQRQLVFIIIVIGQFCGTSLWFAGNAILPELQQEYHWPISALGFLTSSTQLGFILGTLLFAAAGVADRISPSKLFFVSGIVAGICNLIALIDSSSYSLVVVSRALVGFFLAGIYPVGMKLAADWSESGLGRWLGALVGALVLGTAFPHALKIFSFNVEYKDLLISTSLLSIGGSILVLFVPDGPFRKPASTFSFSSIYNNFSTSFSRGPSLGYFGHMWELYAFWTFVPWIIVQHQTVHPSNSNPFLMAFFIIASGALGCTFGGFISSWIGSARVARYSLAGSAICCVFSPMLWHLSPYLFLLYMLVWGILVAADSPQLSALVAASAPESSRGSVITLVICIGFSITIVSIQLLSFAQHFIPQHYLLLLLAPGPLLGVLALTGIQRKFQLR
jgi:MFS family permease